MIGAMSALVYSSTTLVRVPLNQFQTHVEDPSWDQKPLCAARRAFQSLSRGATHLATALSNGPPFATTSARLVATGGVSRCTPGQHRIGPKLGQKNNHATGIVDLTGQNAGSITRSQKQISALRPFDR